MFQYCESLEKAPELPATVLADDCYGYMFAGCTSLTEVPYLPSPTSVSLSYDHMFTGCTSLSSISVAFTSWPGGTGSWLDGVAAEGTFICPSTLNINKRGADYVPENWTILRVVPATSKSNYITFNNGTATVDPLEPGTYDVKINIICSYRMNFLQTFFLRRKSFTPSIALILI